MPSDAWTLPTVSEAPAESKFEGDARSLEGPSILAIGVRNTYYDGSDVDPTVFWRPHRSIVDNRCLTAAECLGSDWAHYFSCVTGRLMGCSSQYSVSRWRIDVVFLRSEITLARENVFFLIKESFQHDWTKGPNCISVLFLHWNGRLNKIKLIRNSYLDSVSWAGWKVVYYPLLRH